MTDSASDVLTGSDVTMIMQQYEYLHSCLRRDPGCQGYSSECTGLDSISYPLTTVLVRASSTAVMLWRDSRSCSRLRRASSLSRDCQSSFSTSFLLFSFAIHGICCRACRRSASVYCTHHADTDGPFFTVSRRRTLVRECSQCLRFLQPG